MYAEKACCSALLLLVLQAVAAAASSGTAAECVRRALQQTAQIEINATLQLVP